MGVISETTTGSSPSGARRRGASRRTVFIALALAAATPLAFAPLPGNDFVVYDDQAYIAGNPRIARGLTLENIRWAFTSTETGSWHPATWVSHLIDGQLFGLNPRGHHTVGLLLHVANTLLLFLALQGLTGARWRSGIAAALFALHPLHVESVAWASERKDVLSAFFWLLATLAYRHHVRRPSLGRYLQVAGWFALGLLSKPSVVTLSFVFLLLDFWPLGRWLLPRGPGAPQPTRATLTRAGVLAAEKAPLLLLTAGLSVAAYVTQKQSGAVSFVDLNTPAVRAGNALAAYFTYLGKTFWPAGLSVFYPYHMPGRSLALPAAAFVAVCAVAVLAARRFPALAVGWFWYVGTLVPMIGLVQLGSQGVADRYTYLPLTGVFLALVWGFADASRRRPALRALGAAAAVALLVVLAALTFRQAGRWRTSVTLFRHALTVTPDSHKVMILLGSALSREGRLEEANDSFRAALRVNPNFKEVNSLVANNLSHLGKWEEAAAHYREESRIEPDNPFPRVYLAAALRKSGRFAEAREQYRELIRISPQDAFARTNLGLLLARDGKWAEAAAQFEQAVRLNPGDALAREQLREARTRLADGIAK